MTTTECQEPGCTAPPGLSGTALIAAVDGEADPETLMHLCRCPHCTERVERLRDVQRRLRHKLYRMQCPSTQLLVDYCQGLLDPRQRAFITHHIALCPHCANEVDLLAETDPLVERMVCRSVPSATIRRPLL